MCIDQRYSLLAYFFMLNLRTFSLISELPFIPSRPRKAPNAASITSELS